MLEAFGVSAAAETLYLHLLRDPAHGMDELTQSLGRSRDEVRAALDELSRLALLRASRENPLAMRPVAPDVGLEALLARKQADLVDRQHQLDQGRASLALLVAEYAESRPLGEHNTIEEIVGLDAVRTRLEALTHRTRSEVLSLAPGGVQNADTLEASRPLDQQLLDRGVTMRTVYLDSVRNNAPSTAYATWLRNLGGEVRTAPTLPLRMIIVDRATAMIPISPGESSAGAAVLTGHGPVSAMCALFDQIWRSASPLGLSSRRDDQGLTPQEGELLRMLAHGDTDEYIARRMAVSTRTVGRLASDLMARLGTRSRFQMGVRAAELGWLGLERVAEEEAVLAQV
ncbi:DNA-binding CsgD family transcriptional regulator [Catenulispora sp. MAP5-51]|uniref:LuxR C-terminal-related transcriptional regulator n=1 Tax=Catenulispora sp. MAP5-51 TaxID=3156298 RepID=UPI0035183791